MPIPSENPFRHPEILQRSHLLHVASPVHFSEETLEAFRQARALISEPWPQKEVFVCGRRGGATEFPLALRDAVLEVT